MIYNPFVSVVIPCYNYGEYLPDACESLLSQSMGDWECILVNNGCFPLTKNIAESYVQKDSRFIYLESDSKGPSAARNEGLKLAKGKFIQFLDADDKLSSGRFSSLRELLEKKSEVDLVYSNVKYFTTENKNVYFDSLNNLSAKGKGGHQGNGKDLYNLLIRSNIFVINSPLIRRSILEQVGAFSEVLKHLEDWDLWLRISLLINRFEFTEQENALVYVRSHSNSLSRDTISMKLNYLPILFSNSYYSRMTVKNILAIYIVASEFLLDSILSSGFERLFKVLISSVKSFENKLKIIVHFILLPLYLPVYIVLKLYRKFIQ